MTAAFSTPAQLGLAVRYARGLGGFFRRPVTPAEAKERIAGNLAARAENFLRVVEHAVFAVPTSPYRALFEHAGIGLDDVRALVREHGLEPALDQLCDEGVHLRLDEFKGRVPIERGSLRLDVRSRDFDNPLSARHFVQQTGGSRSGGTRVYVDLAHYRQDAVYERQLLECTESTDRPYGIWRPAPPWGIGIKTAMSFAALAEPASRWFTHNRAAIAGRNWKHALITGFTVLASRVYGNPIPRPEHVPLADAWRVAEWLAAMKARGTPAHLNTNVASGVRVCLAALERRLDIAGSLIRVGGEPLTDARALVFARAGCRVVAPYAMGEVGLIGLPCVRAEAPDDVHVLRDKMAVIRRERALGDGAPVDAVICTTLLPTTPKLMLNLETGDFATFAAPGCGCPLEALGYHAHLRGLGSYEKLTSEGMNFLGSDLGRLVDEVLPARFGGGPTDYQFVEEEENGLPRVSLVVSPRVGPVDASDAVGAVIDFLNHVPGAGDAYAERWRQAGTLRLVRREPYATGVGKILALHVTRPRREAHERAPAPPAGASSAS